MAVYTTATSGLWSAGATWVGGVKPPSAGSHSIVINRTGTAFDTFSTDATGYAIGSTAITLTGAVAAGSYVIGEAVQFGSDPNYYTITNWNSVTKVLTVSALIVAIPASATVVKSRGHFITYDEAAGEYGDDTVTAFQINGTLYASRSTNTSLTVVGQLLTAATTAATLDYGRRSASDPIPSGVTATLILNKSSAMVNFKYGLFVADTSNAYFCGATKTVNTTLISTVGVGGTTVDVADATGWAVGDNIVFAPSDGTYNHHDERTIATITPGTGTTATITFTALTWSHATGCPIMNRTSNVTIKNFNTANYSFVCYRHTTTASNNRRELDYTAFQYVGSSSATSATQSFVSSGTSALCTPFVTLSNCSFYNTNFGQAMFLNGWNATGFEITNLGFFANSLSGSLFYTASGTSLTLKDSVVYYTTGPAYSTGFSQGGQGVILNNVTFCGVGSTNAMIQHTNGDGVQYINCKFHSSAPLAGLVWLGAGTSTFTGCDFASSRLWGTPSTPYIIDAGTNFGQVHQGILIDCYFGTPTTGFYKNLATANPAYNVKIANKNLDPLVQEIYTPNGVITRDNTSKISGVTSLKMSPTSATNALTFTLQIPAPTGNLVGVSGILWRDTANTTTVTLSGLGITPSTYTASGSLSANETFFVSGTNITGTDGILTLTISTTGASGNLWVDAISAPQAAAINFGEFDYWSGGLPTQLMTATYTSPSDTWSYLTANANTPGSFGTVNKNNLPLIPGLF